MAVSIQVQLNEKLFLKDPQQTDIGKAILSQSIIMIDRLGIEEFTFKKLASEINSTEATIYRYFENKHKLLVYLISWYWAWLEYLIDFRTANINDPEIKLKTIIQIIAESVRNDPATLPIDESILHRIVISESAKAYLTKHVDDENKEGYFMNFKTLCKKISTAILEINPGYAFSRSLASTVIGAAHEQIYFSEHLPSLSDIKPENKDGANIISYLEHLVFGLIKPEKK